MLRWLESRFFWGIVLVSAGVMFLIQNMFEFQLGAIFWAAMLGFGAAGFLSIFFKQRSNWWAVIPGITLASIGLLILLGVLFPGIAGQLGGFIVLAGIGAAFIVVFLVERENWWAIIPAGVMLTLALIIFLTEILGDLALGGVFFLGLAATFGLVAVLPNRSEKMRWAFIPAGILGFIGIIFIASAEGLISFAVPLGLILLGIGFILRTLINR